MIGKRTLLAALGVAALLGGAAIAQQKSSHEANEHAVQLSKVPPAAIAAAEKDLGGKISKAEITQQNGQQVYELETQSSSGEKKSVYVTAEGKILGHEAEKDDDDD